MIPTTFADVWTVTGQFCVKSSTLDICVQACYHKIYDTECEICFYVFGNLIAADEKNCYINKGGQNCLWRQG